MSREVRGDRGKGMDSQHCPSALIFVFLIGSIRHVLIEAAIALLKSSVDPAVFAP